MKSLKESLFDTDIVARNIHTLWSLFGDHIVDGHSGDHPGWYFDKKRVTEVWKSMGRPKIGSGRSLGYNLAAIILNKIIVNPRDIIDDNRPMFRDYYGTRYKIEIDPDQCEEALEFLKDTKCFDDFCLSPKNINDLKLEISFEKWKEDQYFNRHHYNCNIFIWIKTGSEYNMSETISLRIKY